MLSRKEVDFGCSDAPLNEEQLATAEEKGGEVIHIPLCMGAIVPAYNLPDLPDLVFSGKVLIKIFLGEITSWDHKDLKDLRDHKEHKEQPANKAREERPALLVRRAHRGQMELKVLRDQQGRKARKERKAIPAHKVLKAQLDQQVPLEASSTQRWSLLTVGICYVPHR